METLDDLWERAEDGYYHSLSDLMEDMEIITRKAIKQRCLNELSKAYLTNVLSKACTLIKSKKEAYKTQWRLFYEAKYAQNDLFYPRLKGEWHKAPGAKREYNLIEDYKIVTPQPEHPKPGENEIIN